jgi:hypothetical protein
MLFNDGLSWTDQAESSRRRVRWTVQWLNIELIRPHRDLRGHRARLLPIFNPIPDEARCLKVVFADFGLPAREPEVTYRGPTDHLES